MRLESTIIDLASGEKKVCKVRYAERPIEAENLNFKHVRRRTTRVSPVEKKRP
jgi:hypothetical protein